VIHALPVRNVVSVSLDQALPTPAGAGAETDEPSEESVLPRWMGASAAARTAGEAFHLQFSTGETVSVTGTGLVGRRPLPQPAEYFDHLIQINDVGMSVSKSHLEFGQDEGRFWVSDRYSANGTVIRRPGETAVRCEPGRRYLVPRGSQVEIAEQFFMVG
jgi:hypothetical protein